MLDFRKWYRAHGAVVGQYSPATEMWNTGVAVPNLQGIQIAPMMENDEKNSYGSREHLLSVFVGLEVTLDFVGTHDPSVTEMTGFSSTSSGSGASETRRRRKQGGQNLPYFGLIVGIEAEDEGDVHLIIPYVKLDSLLGLEVAAENQFVVPNVTAKAARLRLADNTLLDLYNELEHATLTAPATDLDTAFADLQIA